MSTDQSYFCDFLIVGQGIAGTVLAHTLIGQGKAVLVVDDWNYSSSSKVAAGLYNPIVFKRLTQSWMIDELLPVAEKFYTDLEQILGEQLFYKKEIVKLFAEKSEKDLWLKKAKEEEQKKYLSGTVEQDFLTEVINSGNGAGFVKQAGNVEVKKMLTLFRAHLKKQNLIIEEKFNYADLLLNGESVNYKGIRAKKIIFCEGFRAGENPYFNWLPFKLTKGEILTIKLSGGIIPDDKCINKGVFILPMGNDVYKVGATHNWNDLNEIPTEQGKNELIEKLNRILKISYQVIAHEAGVRPTVRDRRPLIGLHPKHSSIGIFNGMGTKGIMLAPYFAVHFSETLNGNKTLNKEVDITRFL
ncbi:MAG: FAD-binding oxidoreductase [Bacteroidetes bacterium]|nr:FAD-binding oxidoreductase [Bacteroidota bacterium]